MAFLFEKTRDKGRTDRRVELNKV